MLDLDPRLLGLTLSSLQVYALFFLLGSFTVAALSDVKHLSAQREFLEVWAAFTAVVFLLDLHDAGWRVDWIFGLKWGLLAALSVASLDKVGLLFRLAVGDVLAIAAAASLLSPVLIALFFLVLKAASWPASKVLARGNAYPFLPVVAVATIALLGFGFWME